ncbi:MAG: ThiF family adenylyltransferase [Clostridia bacterium]|nr:ThiF family adenylyltransferase [Clostridia bacterium]
MSLKSDIQGFDISSKSAVVVGCGGLGTNASVHLAGAGIGRLLLIDFDSVEERNLNRQYFYTKEDTGIEKARLLAERLKAYAPEVEIEYKSGKFEDSFVDGYDIVIIAVDNIATRAQVNACCKKAGIPCVNGSINGFFGTAYLFIPGKMPDLEAAGCLNETGNKNKSPSTTAAIIGAFESQLAIDYFLGKTESAGKLYIYDNNEIRKLEIRSEKID